VRFAGFCSFVRTHPLPINAEDLNTWMRVLSNLVENSDIERPTDFVDALKAITQIEAQLDRILEYLAEGSDIGAFNRQQVREERIKAALILKGDAWKERILEAEGHAYFKGQIEFLLKFSGILDHWLLHKSVAWPDDENCELLMVFDQYLQKSRAIFDADGLRRFAENKAERALLALGDYTLSYGKNKSFLQNRVTSGERRPTWKLLLRGHVSDAEHEGKRELVRRLLDEIALPQKVQECLDEVIGTAAASEPWREMLIELPELIAYCGQRMFRLFDDGSAFLISKLRTSSEHVELGSYFLYRTLLSEMHARGDLSPFAPDYKRAKTEDFTPFALLSDRAKIT